LRLFEFVLVVGEFFSFLSFLGFYFLYFVRFFFDFFFGIPQKSKFAFLVSNFLKVAHRKLLCLSVTDRKIIFFQGYPQKKIQRYRVTHTQKDVFVIKLPTEMRFVSELPTENRNCLSLSRKEGFFKKSTHRTAGKTWGYLCVFLLFFWFESTLLSFFLSWVSKTQPNHLTKRMTSIRLATQDPRTCPGTEDRSIT